MHFRKIMPEIHKPRPQCGVLNWAEQLVRT
jgi:hypothetical protein